MKPIIPFAILLQFGLGLLFACSSESEPRTEPFASVGKPAPAVAPTLPPSDASLYRKALVMGDNPFAPPRPEYVVDYAIQTIYEATGMEISNARGRRQLKFHTPRRYNMVEGREQYLRYMQAYGDHKDSIPFYCSYYLRLIANIDKIQMLQYQPNNGQYTDVSHDYALVYNDVYDFVRTPPRLAYATQYWRIKETARRISDCDKNACRWAFEERVPVQIQPLEGVKPDANTVIRIALSNGQQIHTAWNDTAAANPSERDWWDH